MNRRSRRLGSTRTRSRSFSGSRSLSLLPPMSTAPKKTKKQTPQAAVDELWENFNSKFPGQVCNILPKTIHAKQAADDYTSKGEIEGAPEDTLYEKAAELCKAKVEKIVKECRRVNEKYRDRHFDIEFDLNWGKNDCLDPLDKSRDDERDEGYSPQSVKRVGDIFDKPQFYIDDPTANDVRQGRDGDCWFMAALCTLANKKGLIEKVCVARDEEVGVYGFVFHRDGEWRSEVIDDKLYLTKPDYDESIMERIMFEDRTRVNSEEDYRRTYQSNSGALYFAQCEDPNETWLPLMEKAYAKAHGDYASISGGFTGEGLEDLTGGVTTELLSTDILDRDHFWNTQLLKVNDEFLFGCATGIFRNWGSWGSRKGIHEGHAYSIMRAVEVDDEDGKSKKSLLLLKNPWGEGEWNGAWSDGSKEWTPYWMEKLGHKFGDDGAFWISYDDLLRKYQSFDRTRLFSSEWDVSQQWTSLNIGVAAEYHDTKFAFTLEKDASVCIVLSQLDDRYFRGFRSKYRFELSFRVHKAGEEDYIVRSHDNYCMNRSVSTELDLKAGEYHVLMRIGAERDTSIKTAEEVIRENIKYRQDKLVRIGLSHDLAKSKGQYTETEEEKKGKEAAEVKKKNKARRELKEKLLKEKKKAKHIAIRETRKRRAAKAKREAKAAEKAEKRKAAEQEREKEKGKGKEEETVTDIKKEENPNEKGNKDGALHIDSQNSEKTSKDADAKDGKTAPEIPERVASLATNFPPEPSVAGTDNLNRDPVAPPPPNFSDGDDFSDTDSEVSDISDGELDEELARAENEKNEVPFPPLLPANEDEEDELETDPWNAFVVVGLRVYSKGSNVAIKVVRPRTWSEDDEIENQLDVDDSAADAIKGTDIPTVTADAGEESAKKIADSEEKSEAKPGRLK